MAPELGDCGVLGQAIGALLPAAAAVALSPIPIVAVVLVLDSARARTNGFAFAVGWIAGLTAVCVLVETLASGTSNSESATATGVSWAKAGIGVMLLVLAARSWRKRPRAGEVPELPGWMASIDSFSWTKSLGLGAALSAANPKNLALTFAAAASIAEAGLGAADATVATIVFVVIASTTVAGAVLFAVLAPNASRRPLGSVKRFMAANNATIMMVILLIFGVKMIGDAVGGLSG